MKIEDENKKIDVEAYWNKKKFIPNWSKLFLTCIYVSFILVVGIYAVDLYVKTHDLTFIKFKINPEFGFVVNGKDKVVYYIPLNDDAKNIYNLDMFKGKMRTEALEKAISVAKENNYLVDGEDKGIIVTVVSDNKDKVEEFEEKVIEDLKQADKEIVSTVVEATKEEVENFGNIELDNVPTLNNSPSLPGSGNNKPTQNGGTNVNGTGGSAGTSNACKNIGKNEQECNYTKLTTKDMSGDTRFSTAVKISDTVFGKTNDNIVIVNSDDFVDGYLASSLSIAYDAPILTTYKDSIDPVIEKEIKDLKAKNVYIIGGTGVVSANVENKIKELLPSESKVSRIKGTDRFLTSTAVADAIDKKKPFTKVFLVPSSDSMIDAGMVASISGKLNIPILYTKANEFTPAVKNYILDKADKIDTIYMVSGLFDSATEKAIKDFAKANGIKDVVPLKGDDRYKTNAAILNHFNETKTFKSVTIVNNQVDLVTVASFAAKNGSALFYVSNNNIDSEQAKLIANNTNISKLYYFGGDDIKVAFRYMVYEIKKSNVSICTNPTKELLYMNKHAVIYVPHQDDESSHLGQFITGAVERLGSANVHLVVMTDGDGSAAKNTPAVQSILTEYGLTFTQARDREFLASAKELCVGDYKFVENLGLKDVKRFPDSGVKNNVSKVKQVMKYYDNLYKNDGGVTHFTYTNFDSHTDHNTLGSTLKSLYFDTSLDDKSFSNVYLGVKYLEYYEKGVNKKIPSKYVMEYSNPTSWEYMQNAFTKYQKNISNDGDMSNDLLGMGYASAGHVFEQFLNAMTPEVEVDKKSDYYPLRTPIHVPFK